MSAKTSRGTIRLDYRGLAYRGRIVVIRFFFLFRNAYGNEGANRICRTAFSLVSVGGGICECASLFS